MSQKFAVLDAHQALDSAPICYFPKAIALLKVRRQEYERIGPRLIRRILHVHGFKKTIEPDIPRAAGTLPPREIPGVFFEQPKSDQWKALHRTVSFMPKDVPDVVAVR